MKKIIIFLSLLLIVLIPHSTQAAFLDCAEKEIVADVNIIKTECRGECKNYRIISRNINLLNNRLKAYDQHTEKIIDDHCEENTICSNIRVDYFPLCTGDKALQLFISKNTTSSEPTEVTPVTVSKSLFTTTIQAEKKVDQNVFSFEISVIPKSLFIQIFNFIRRKPEFLVEGIGGVILISIGILILRKIKTNH